ncbi:MAG: hypothetical protein ACREPA_10755 [Candidatus Dormibacteraceae bacterium]
MDPAGLRLASWARANTDPRAVFLAAPEHNHPVPALAGRRVVLGYPGWVWSYGLGDLGVRSAAVADMLSGAPDAARLLAAYHVAYVVIGPAAMRVYHADPAYWSAREARVYANAEYTVYRVR